MSELQFVAEALAYEAATSAWLAGHGDVSNWTQAPPAESSTIVEVGQRVAVCIDGRQRLGTVREIGRLGYARVELDRAWMHDWLPLSELAPIADVSGIPDARLPLGAPVQLANGVAGVIIGRSTCDRQRYEVAWFDRHYWCVRRRWMDRARLTTCGCEKIFTSPSTGAAGLASASKSAADESAALSA